MGRYRGQDSNSSTEQTVDEPVEVSVADSEPTPEVASEVIPEAPAAPVAAASGFGSGSDVAKGPGSSAGFGGSPVDPATITTTPAEA